MKLKLCALEGINQANQMMASLKVNGGKNAHRGGGLTCTATDALVDTETGEIEEKTLDHECDEVREFYAAFDGSLQASKRQGRCSGFCS